MLSHSFCFQRRCITSLIVVGGTSEMLIDLCEKSLFSSNVWTQMCRLLIMMLVTVVTRM